MIAPHDDLTELKKYQRVERWVIESLSRRELMPGDLLPSEGELCTKFAVGRNSVRTALVKLSHAGYVETKKGIGTFCKSMSGSRAMTVGFVCFFSNSPIFQRIISGCYRVLSRNGFQVLLNQSEFDLQKEREVLLELERRRVDGIVIEPIFSGSGPSNADLLRRLESKGIRIVLVDTQYPGFEFTSILLDDLAGGRLVASHLLQKRHRRIGIVYDSAYYPKRLRMQAASEELTRNGVTVPSEWIIAHDGPARRGQLYSNAFKAISSMRELPTAFICTSDEESLTLMDVALDLGKKVPGDFSIISFDNSSFADLRNVSLTSVDHPGEYIGDLAATILSREVCYPLVERKTVTWIAPRLVERTSVREAESYERPSGERAIE